MNISNIILFSVSKFVGNLLSHYKINAEKLITRSEKRFFAKVIIKSSFNKLGYREEYK